MKNRKKQYLRSLKLAKKLAAVAMLSATLAGASTSLVKLTSSTAYAAEQTGRRVEKIPFKTETKEDPTLPEGEKKVVQKGVEGEKEYVTTTIADVPGQDGTAQGSVAFTTKATGTTSNQIKPR